MQTYFLWEGGILGVDSYYYVGDRWFTVVNGTETEIPMPDFANTADTTDATNTVVWLKGPGAGTNETSVTIDGNIIYVQGTSHRELTLAGDRLALIVLGINIV
jgi:hypothetical protein